MKIISKYVLREHAGPFTFALTALTSLLLLNYIAKQFGQLVGKGLPWTVIGEFFLLSLPFTMAMTLPMAVLIATLYAFSRLAAENEITALRASGVGMARLMVPVVLASAVVSLFMVYFNDQVLPATNHALSTLQGDIARKKPTFALREQVINEVSPGRFYIRPNDIDEYSNRMRDVTIYDMSDALRRRTIYADSGMMELAPNGSDLQMTLYHGYMQEVPRNDPAQLQRLYYTVDHIRVANVANSFDRDTAGSVKSDREKTVCELQEEVATGRREAAIARRDLAATLVALTREATTGAPARNELVIPPPSSGSVIPSPRNAAPLPPPPRFDTGRLYCALVDRVRQLVVGQPVTVASSGGASSDGASWLASPFALSELHAAEPPSHTLGALATAQDTTKRAAPDTTKRAAPDTATRDASAPVRVPLPPSALTGQKSDSAVRMQSSTVAQPAAASPSQSVPPSLAPPVVPTTAAQDSAAVVSNAAPNGNLTPFAPTPVNATAAIEAARARLIDGLRQENENAVEVHKKFALAAACVIFMLLGAPIALRFPRGGVGFVIGASLVIFAVYYVGLIGGEPLGDRGILPPFLSMWLPNLILLLVAIVLISRMGSEASTSRGGEVSEMFAALRHRLARPFRRARRPAATAAPHAAPAMRSEPVDDSPTITSDATTTGATTADEPEHVA